MRMLLVLTVQNGWTCEQLDVKAAFLYGDLSEEVYMELPPGYNMRDQKGQKGPVRLHDSGTYCARLHISIYGLEQSLQEWNAYLTAVLGEYDLHPCPFDPCVYTNDQRTVILAVYVDDMSL